MIKRHPCVLPCRPFPLEGCAADDDIYSGLSDQIEWVTFFSLLSNRPLNILNIACVLLLLFISDTVDEDDDLYDFVEDEENKGDEIYEDLMRTEEPPEIVGVGSVERVV